MRILYNHAYESDNAANPMWIRMPSLVASKCKGKDIRDPQVRSWILNAVKILT